MRVGETSEGQLKQAPKEKEKKSNKKYPKMSRWTHEENVLYKRFLRQNSRKFTHNCSKKFLKFEKMSYEIGSKTPNQCRSHHQKMIIKFKTIQNIILGRVYEEGSEV